MTTFLALYRGRTVGEAQMVAVTADPVIVAEFAERVLERTEEDESPDPALRAIERGRRRALRIIKGGAE